MAWLAAALIALGGGVLIGWAVGIDPLMRVFPGLITMKPNAAMAFLLGGLSLWMIRDGEKISRVSVGLAAAVAAIGGLTVFEYAWGVNLGIDQILFREPSDTIASLYPGRMHPTTAFDFGVLGLALILIAIDREHRSSQAMALLAALVAGSTMIGYLYGVRVFVGLAAYGQMALHTSLGMLVLSAGVLLARPDRGLMAAVSGDGPGGLMARRLLPVAILVPITLDGLTILALRAGMFDDRYATAVRVIVTIAVFVAFIGRNAHSLHRVDHERRQAEADRIAGERRFTFLVEAMPLIVWTTRPDGRPETINRLWFDFTGQDRSQGWDGRAALHPDDLARSVELWKRALRSGESYQGEFRLRRADGAYRWHLVRARPMRDETGRIVQWVGTSTDVDDQKRASETRYRSLVEATTAIVWNTPASGEFESDQPGWSAFTGQTFDQLKGWGWLEAVHPDDRSRTARIWSDAVAGRILYQVEHRLRRHDGEYRYMLVRAVPILEEGDLIREWVGVHTDIDAQKKAEEASADRHFTLARGSLRKQEACHIRTGNEQDESDCPAQNE